MNRKEKKSKEKKRKGGFMAVRSDPSRVEKESATFCFVHADIRRQGFEV